MSNVFSAVLVILFALAAPFCSAQENAAPAEVSSAPDGTDAGAPVPVPDPVQAGISAPAAAPSEWQILGSQWKRVGPDLLHQQKDMWLFPVSLVRGHHWKPALALIGTTALLTTLDAHDAKWVRSNTEPLGRFNHAFAGYNTATATEAFASAFYLVGIARRNAYDQQTFLLAGEAVIDSESGDDTKDADGREAPISYPSGGDFRGQLVQSKKRRMVWRLGQHALGTRNRGDVRGDDFRRALSASGVAPLGRLRAGLGGSFPRNSAIAFHVRHVCRRRARLLHRALSCPGPSPNELGPNQGRRRDLA